MPEKSRMGTAMPAPLEDRFRREANAACGVRETDERTGRAARLRHMWLVAALIVAGLLLGASAAAIRHGGWPGFAARDLPVPPAAMARMAAGSALRRAQGM